MKGVRRRRGLRKVEEGVKQEGRGRGWLEDNGGEEG